RTAATPRRPQTRGRMIQRIGRGDRPGRVYTDIRHEGVAGDVLARRRVKRRPWVVLALCTALSTGCRRRAPEAAPASAAAPPPAISWAGCAVVRVGPRCELGPERKLIVWIPGDEGPRLT